MTGALAAAGRQVVAVVSPLYENSTAIWSLGGKSSW